MLSFLPPFLLFSLSSFRFERLLSSCCFDIIWNLSRWTCGCTGMTWRCIRAKTESFGKDLHACHCCMQFLTVAWDTSTWLHASHTHTHTHTGDRPCVAKGSNLNAAIFQWRNPPDPRERSVYLRHGWYILHTHRGLAHVWLSAQAWSTPWAAMIVLVNSWNSMRK